MTPQERIGYCKQVREQAANAAATIFSKRTEGTELEFTNEWFAELAKKDSLYADGWYAPPPHGLQFMFGSPESSERLVYDSLRKPEHWPSDKYRYETGSVGAFYASPVHKESGAIGDFGMTVYAGDNVLIQNHIRNCLERMEEVLEQIQHGMKFLDIFACTQEVFKENELTNEGMMTILDPLGNNLGHTIPWSYEEQTQEEKTVLATGDMEQMKDVISKKRVFINQAEELEIAETFASTFEARLRNTTNPEVPNIFFHYIVTFVDGKKEVLGGFNPIFKTLGMGSFITSKY